MQIRDFTEAQVKEVYAKYLCADFPADERKPLSMILPAFRRGGYRCLGLFEDNGLRGYAFLVPRREGVQTNYLLDYFAILEGYRNQGFGSRFLSALPGILPDAACILIEIEEPACAQPTDAEQRLRRQAFYFRCGCVDTGVQASVFGVRFRLLELPVKSVHDTAETRQIYGQIYRQILAKEQYDAKIAFIS